MADRKSLIERNSLFIFHCKLYLWWRSLNIFGGCYLEGLSGMERDTTMLSPKCVTVVLNFFETVFHLKMGMVPLTHLTFIVRVKWDTASPLKAKASARFNMELRCCFQSPLLRKCLSSTQQSLDWLQWQYRKSAEPPSGQHEPSKNNVKIKQPYPQGADTH